MRCVSDWFKLKTKINLLATSNSVENGNKDGIEENLLRAMINNSSILDAIHRRRGSRTFCNLNLLLANPFPNVEAIPRLHNFFGF